MTSPARRRAWSGPHASRLAVALVVLAALVPYIATLHFGFVAWDDPQNVFANRAYNPPTFANIAHLWNIKDPYFQLYVPVTYTAWGIIAEFASGPTSISVDGIWPATHLDPFWFHAANLLSHTLAAVALWLVLRRLRFPPLSAGAGAIFFAVHPMQTDAVAWVSGLRDVLSGALALLALWQLLCAVPPDDASPRTLDLPAAIIASICFLLAILAKPTVALLPITAVGLLWFYDPRTIRPAWRLMVFWMAVALADVAVTRFAQPAPPEINFPIWFRPFVALDSLGFYVRQLFATWPLLIDHGRNPMWLWQDPTRLWPIAFLIPAGLLAVYRPWRRWNFAALALFLPPLIPVLGLITFDFQYYSTVADHYIYLAMAGPALLVAAMAANTRQTGRVVITFILVALAIRTAFASHVWSDTQTLCDYTLSIDPTNTAANLLLADTDKARAQADTDASLRRRHFDSAMARYQIILSHRPKDGVALSHEGDLDLQFGRVAPAASLLAQAAQVRPDDPQCRDELAGALDQLGLAQEARAQFATAISLSPDDPNTHANYGIFLARQGLFSPAISEFNSALQLDPHNQIALRGMDFIAHYQPSVTQPTTNP
jgi:hypothetical protein